MRKQTVMFTVLPNGLAAPQQAGGQRLRLSVLISPRLMTNEGMPRPVLSQFPDFERWPDTRIRFAVRFEGGPTYQATVEGSAPSINLWTALFKATTYVRPYSFPDLHNRRVLSFPVRHVMGFLKQEYLKVASRQAAEHPPVEMVGNRQSFGQISNYREGRKPNQGDFDPDAGMRELLERYLEKSKAVPSSATPNPPFDFYQMRLFHQPRSRQRLAVPVPDLDFHQVVASLGDYPEIMRRMGLVVDLEVPLTKEIPATSRVQVIPTWAPAPGANSTDVMPWTHYELAAAGGIFRPAARPVDPEIRNGMLDLSDAAGYSVEQVDVDGAALKAVDFANNLLRSNSGRYRTSDTADRASLPSMRSSGLSVVRHGRAVRLVRALADMKQKNTQAETGADVGLYAEDVTRGYRVDIWDSRSQVWNSLAKRRGIYKFTDGGILVSHDDEGIITMGVTQAADGSFSDLYLHESLFRWEGWSLAAPRPGKVISTEDTAAEVQNKAATDFGLETHFEAAPRSLPRLRFGNTYRVRARAVDLAGNSLPVEHPDGTTATEAVTYGRFEPVSSPAVLLRAATTEGESAERMVIRSNYNTTATADAQRHIAPSKVAQLTAEIHGMFDVGSGLDKAAYDAIVAREGLFNADAVHPEAQVALPYLPDPLGRGAALLGLPGLSPLTATKVPFADSAAWPDWLPFRLLVEEGAGAPQWDATNRVLTVRLPKAEIVPVRLSCYPDAGDLLQMGLWLWLEQAGLPAAQLNALRQLVLQGTHWMLTPYRQITLVHAVQQPLLAPQYQSLKALRALGSTFATLQDSVPVHGKSTNKLDVLAEWEEPVDNLSEPKWRKVSGRAHACEVPVEYGQSAVTLDHKHEFGDTRYRRVQYTGVATSRFREYFQERTDETLVLSGTTAQALAHSSLMEASVQSADGAVTYQRDADYKLDQAAGTIARVEGGAISDGQSVKVSYAYLPGPVTRETAAPVAVDVLNSARPAAPRVLYMVPTFEWSREAIDDGAAVRRAGGGLRIYMERPWFSSGDGELLGAVLWTPTRSRLSLVPAPTRPPEAMKPFVTQWGKDPIWLSGDTYTVPSVTHFPQAVQTASGLTIEEAPGTTVAVAAHKVGYDEERRLWYCDMAIEAGASYFPFVRLALARYQPKSVANAHLSRVVLADFAQLAPDRLVTIVRDAGQPGVAAVTVCGPGYTMSGLGRGSSEFEVAVETKRADLAGELAWVPASSQVFPLVLTDSKSKSFTWSGGVNLQSAADQAPLRLVVKEYERFAADGAGIVPLTERRLVFAAVLEL